MPPMGGEWDTLRTLYDTHSTSSMSSGGRNAMVAKAIELFSRAWKLSKHGERILLLTAPISFSLLGSFDLSFNYRCKRRVLPESV